MTEIKKAGTSYIRVESFILVRRLQMYVFVIIVRIPWTKEESQKVHNHFVRDISMGTLPGKVAIEGFILDSGIERPWKNIKDFIRNVMKKK